MNHKARARAARVQWKETQARWRSQAQAFIAQVQALDEPLRSAVAWVVELVSQDHGSLVLEVCEQSNGDPGLKITKVVIDQEFLDQMVRVYGSREDIGTVAFKWIVDTLQANEATMAYLMFAFKHVQMGEAQDPDQSVYCVSDGVVCCISESRIVGLHLGGSPAVAQNILPLPT